jgi:hypothetical protein
MSDQGKSRTIERQARAMYEALAKSHGLPAWDAASPEMRETWRKCASGMAEVAKGINYDD